MRQLLTIGLFNFRDVLMRPVLWLVMAATALGVFVSRYLAMGALGQELELMKEMALSTMSAGTVLVAVFAAVPSRRQQSVLEAQRVLLTRPLSAWVLVAGKLSAVKWMLLLAMLLWTGSYWLALQSFAHGSEAAIFQWNRPTTPWAEFSASLPAILMIFIQGLVLVACAQLFGSGGSQIGALVAVFLLLLAGTWASGRGFFSWLVPDFSLTSPGRWLKGQGSLNDGVGALIHACGWILLLSGVHALRLTKPPRRAT